MRKKSNSKPLVSIIILTYRNGLAQITRCLKSLYKINYGNFEVILVDNASLDNTLSYVKKNYPTIKVIKNKTNTGFSQGNNQGLLIAQGKYVLLLNNDTEVSPNFLNILVNYLEKNEKTGLVQPKIRQLKEKEKLDACASYLTNTGFLYHYGYSQNEKDQKFNINLKMYSAKGACMLVRKNVIDKIGFLDEDYFAYFEETDFCHRVWLAGYSVAYVPESQVFHLGGSGERINSVIEYHSYKNRIQTYIKNLEIINLIKILPPHIVFCLAISLVYFVSFRFESGIAILKAIFWNLFNLKNILDKRKKVQGLRKVRDSTLLPVIKKPVRFNYYLHFFLNPREYYDFKKLS